MPSSKCPAPKLDADKAGQMVADLISEVASLAAQVEMKRFDVRLGGEFVDESVKAREQYTAARKQLREVESRLVEAKERLAAVVSAALQGMNR